jgi:arylsulfatase
MVSQEQPNVLCFVLDQLRYDHLGCTGNETIETPNIDGLADRGVRFDRNYVSNPLCMPSRASIFTGLPPRMNGVRTNGIPLDDDIPTFVDALRDDGYRTCSVGKLHCHQWLVPRARNESVDLDDIDVAPFPEAEVMWDAGKIDSLPEPYHGFEETKFVGGHSLEGSGVWGDYANWLEEENPESYEKLSRAHPANESWNAPNAFEWDIPEEDHYNRWIADETIDVIKSHDADDERFFMWCSFPDPHHAYATPEPWVNKYDPDEIELPVRREGELDDLPPFYEQIYMSDDTLMAGIHGQSDRSDEELREMKAITYGMISFVDQEIGRILSTLSEAGLREDTLIIFMSDHGDMMGDHWMIRKGPFHFEGLLQAPMIWSWPGKVLEGETVDGLTSGIDIAPTILELCDTPIPMDSTFIEQRGENVPGETGTPLRPIKVNEGYGDMQTYTEVPEMWPGESLRPLLEGRSDAIRDGVIVENDEDYLGYKIRTYITDRYKLTIYPGEEFGELYDLKEDPDELRNRWDDGEYEEVKRELYREFLELYVLEEGHYPPRSAHA